MGRDDEMAPIGLETNLADQREVSMGKMILGFFHQEEVAQVSDAPPLP